MTSPVLPRSDVPREHTWDVSSVFPSDAAWEAAIAGVVADLPGLAAFRGRLHEGAATLAEWVAHYEQVMRRVTHIYLYAGLHYNVDTGDQAALARQDRAIGLYARTIATASFAEPELLAVGFPTVRAWVAEEPRLAVYAHYVDELERRQAHVRSAEVEEVLGMVAEPFGSATEIHSILADADLRFPPALNASGQVSDVAQGTINALLTHHDRKVRRTAWEGYADSHLALKNTMAACLATGVKQNVFVARARRYGSALEASLTANHIPIDVFHNLIDTFRAQLPIWHRYWRIRRRALGYEQLHVYDIKAPLTKTKIEVPFATAIEWISAGMQPLGAEYVEMMRRGALEQRWIDIYPNRGKRMGAFSSGMPGTHPFILLNYANDIYSMSTLAHELGHSMHSYYTWRTQPFVYANYSIFLAEVASNFNQALVRDFLLKHNTSADFQIAVIEEAMANFHRYFFIMPTLARFELAIHARIERGEGLNADVMIQLMAELFREGYGDEVVIDADRIGSTWCQFSTHLYSNFYVYQYATGISAAHALAEDVLTGRPDAVERYFTFLQSGSSRYPLETLRAAGVDMSTPEPVERAFGVLARYVERLEQLTG